MDPLSPGLNLRPHLLSAGVTDQELRRLRRTGVLETVRPGAYLLATHNASEDMAARHVHAVRAAAAQLGPGAVISHVSAAVLHGLPLWNAALDRVHATRDRRSGARRSALVHLHAAALQPDEVGSAAGVLVTSVARTVVDLARLLPFEEAVVPADAALHRHLVTREALVEALDKGAHRLGDTRARRVVAFSDARAESPGESPGESRSRVAMHRAGLPAPPSSTRSRSWVPASTSGGRSSAPRASSTGA